MYVTCTYISTLYFYNVITFDTYICNKEVLHIYTNLNEKVFLIFLSDESAFMYMFVILLVHM